MKLFTSQTANGASPNFVHKGSGFLNVYVAGVLDTADVTVEAQLPDGSGWAPLDGGIIAALGMHTLSVGPFIGRVSLKNATVSTNIDVWAESDTETTPRRLFSGS